MSLLLSQMKKWNNRHTQALQVPGLDLAQDIPISAQFQPRAGNFYTLKYVI